MTDPRPPYGVVQTALADAISDRIVAVVNAELETMRAEDRIAPLTVLAGQLLGVLTLLSTAPSPLPPTIVTLRAAVVRCLRELPFDGPKQ